MIRYKIIIIIDCLSTEQRWKVDQGKGVDSQAGGGEAPEVEDVNENPGPQEMEQFVSGKFHFVDLAGSERVSKTGNKGERFKGTCSLEYRGGGGGGGRFQNFLSCFNVCPSYNRYLYFWEIYSIYVQRFIFRVVAMLD